MSGICGWYGWPDEGDAAPERLQQMVRLLPRSPYHRDVSLVANGAAIAGTTLTNQCFTYRDGQTLVLVNGPVRWSGPPAPDEPDIATRFARLYIQRGPEAVQALQGNFVAAHLDLARNEVFLATDRLGTHPLSYHVDRQSVVFASHGDAVSRRLGHRPALDPQTLYDYIYFHMVPVPRSVFVGQHRLPPGHYLIYRDGEAQVRPYWEPNWLDIRPGSFAALKEQFLTLLEDSVRDAVGQDQRVGAFLSGGTDSSTVAGVLGKVTGQPARTYSIGFDAPGYDETEYARIAARAFGTDHHEYYVTPGDVARSMPEVAAAYDQPYGNASAIPTYYCARMAREDGIDVLLGGDGGDELFGGNARYAKQTIFSYYHRVPSVVRSSVVEPLLHRLPAIERVGILRKIRSYVDQANVPMPDRMESYNLLDRIGPHQLFTDEFLEQVDTDSPKKMLRELYHSAHAADMLNRMLAMDMKITLTDNDIPKVVMMCHVAGVEPRFPLLNEKIIDFASHLPPRLKLKGTRLRYFFKKALQDFLPPEIITKQKHGFGLPFGLWLSTEAPLQQLAADSLDGLCERRIVREQLIDELRGTHLDTHAAYYGTLIWVLVMLEHWLRSREL